MLDYLIECIVWGQVNPCLRRILLLSAAMSVSSFRICLSLLSETYLPSIIQSNPKHSISIYGHPIWKLIINIYLNSRNQLFVSIWSTHHYCLLACQLLRWDYDNTEKEIFTEEILQKLLSFSSALLIPMESYLRRLFIPPHVIYPIHMFWCATMPPTNA